MSATAPTSDGARRAIVVDESAGGARLDAFLARVFPEHSRARWRALIEDGRVLVDGASVRSSHRLAAGACIEAHEPPVAPTTTRAEDIPLAVVYEDDALIVVDKPAGMVVHPAAGVAAGTLVNALLHHVPELDVGGEERPGIVHRLDKETSGLLVCAKHERSLRALQRAFHDRVVEKRYRAWCRGRPREDVFDLVTGHARHPRDRKRFTTKLRPPETGVEGAVRRAAARYEVVATRGGVSEVIVRLETGRTHQIRAQLADVGHPLLADTLYGGEVDARRLDDEGVRRAALALARHALHAEELSFPHPDTGESMRFRAPLPDDVRALYDALRDRSDDVGDDD